MLDSYNCELSLLDKGGCLGQWIDNVYEKIWAYLYPYSFKSKIIKILLKLQKDLEIHNAQFNWFSH